MRAHHIQVRRTARYFMLGEPVVGVRSAWFVLHGYRQSAERFLRRFTAIASPSRLIVAPEGLSRFYVDDDGGAHGPEHRVGASWMTREDRESEIADYVSYLDALRDRIRDECRDSVQRWVVLGFSQGAHTAVRWATLGSQDPDALILWGAGLPRDLDHEVGLPLLRRLGVNLVFGTEDPLAPLEAVRRVRREMRELEIPFESESYPGGHVIHEGALRAIQERIDPRAH